MTRTLTCLGIVDKFDAIIGAEDYLKGKPSPDPFLTAAQRLGVPPENASSSRTQTPYQAAEAAGMQWCWFPPERSATTLNACTP